MLDGTYDVRTVTVDGLLDELRLPKVHVVHMDIQAAERLALDGMRQSLARRAVEHIFIGTHNDDLHAECEDVLSGAGYRITVSIDCRASASGDGVLAATSRR